MQVTQFSISDKKLVVRKKVDDMNISSEYEREGVETADAIEVAGSVIASKIFKLLYGDSIATATYFKKMWVQYADDGSVSGIKVQAETQTAIVSDVNSDTGEVKKEGKNVTSKWKNSEWVTPDMVGVDEWFSTIQDAFIPSLPTA